MLNIASNGQEIYVENWKSWAKYATFKALWYLMTVKWFGIPSLKYKTMFRTAQKMWAVSQLNKFQS